MTLHASTKRLGRLLEPDSLVSVLASLKFRKIIKSYTVTADLTSVTLSPSRALALSQLFENNQEET
jgi:hypothetical protein